MSLPRTDTADLRARHLRAAGAALLLRGVSADGGAALRATQVAGRNAGFRRAHLAHQTHRQRSPDGGVSPAGFAADLRQSSELDRIADNRPDAFFRDRPTGFTAFPIGRGGTTCLLILQKLAAAGPAARGRKTVVFLSPTWFAKEEVSESAVSANLTPTLLGGWIFAGSLSLPLKSEIARRLLDYPDSLEKQPLLTAAVDCLCNPTPLRRVLLAAMTPAGLAQNAILRWVEYGAILREMINYRRSTGENTRT